MYSIMIVDDEAGVRNSIKAKIDWQAFGFQIVAEASNGEEALAFLKQNRLPEVLLTDIRMPQMDGIELINACKQLYPLLKIVVLSGYSDYTYMQAAIQAGVRDYLLKPVGRRELAALLEKLAAEVAAQRTDKQLQHAEMRQRKEQLLALQEQMLLRMVKEDFYSLLVIKERLEQLQLSALVDEQLLVRFITVEMRVPTGRLGDERGHLDLLHMAFQMLCRETASTFPGIFPFYDASHPSMMHFLVQVHSNGVEGIDAMERLVRQMKTNIYKYLKLDSVIGVGEAVNGIRQYKNGYSSSMLSWSRSTIHGTNGEGSLQVQNLIAAFSPELERQLVISVENGDHKAYSSLIERIIPSSVEFPMYSFTFIASRILLLFHSIAKKYEAGEAVLQKRLWDCQMTIGDFHSREQILDQLEELARLVMIEALKTRTSSGQSIVKAIQKYVDDNFSYELALASLASMFHLNETYLSGLFKQHVGVTFSEYLTGLRMKKAGELLAQSDLKLTDIAMLVGISSSSYFSTSFKKYYGLSPKEYREQNHSKA
ncbi:two-component system response regulator YesN [Paenibacillus castaneae]|uniref:response regulator transcription factor n=1 Tax=Paenibacillus castaneae TaxID=474957 RepID=UPI000C9C2C04|nr:response regulator [Paenibacillus castaneae]NIK74992.1 two-component system response regulator YesN [Paenibacillus castaneae]